MLREVIGKKRILLNDDQRRRLAVKGKMLGLRRLRELAGIACGQKLRPRPNGLSRFALEVLAR